MTRIHSLLVFVGLLCAGCSEPAPSPEKSPAPKSGKVGTAQQAAPSPAAAPWTGLWRLSLNVEGSKLELELALREAAGAPTGRMTVLSPSSGDLIQHTDCALVDLKLEGKVLTFVAPIMTGADLDDAWFFALEPQEGQLLGHMRGNDSEESRRISVAFTRHKGEPARTDGLSGAWEGSLSAEGKPVGEIRLTLKDEAGEISGTVQLGGKAPLTLVEGKRRGRELGFMVPVTGKVDRDTLVFGLRIGAAELRGQSWENSEGSQRVDVTLKRKAQ